MSYIIYFVTFGTCVLTLLIYRHRKLNPLVITVKATPDWRKFRKLQYPIIELDPFYKNHSLD